MLARERAKEDAYWLLVDELDMLIAEALEIIARRRYRDGGSVVYPSGNFASMRGDPDSARPELHVGWMVACLPTGETSHYYVLDDAANLTVDQNSFRRSPHDFERLRVTPVYQSSTRERNTWSIPPAQGNPLLLIYLMKRFVESGGVLVRVEGAEHKPPTYKDFEAIVGRVVS